MANDHVVKTRRFLLPQTVALLAEAGAAAVTVHGRTAEQRWDPPLKRDSWQERMNIPCGCLAPDIKVLSDLVSACCLRASQETNGVHCIVGRYWHFCFPS